MKKQLRVVETSSVPKLKAAVRQLWASFSPPYLQNFASSVPKCLEDFVKRKVNASKY